MAGENFCWNEYQARAQLSHILLGGQGSGSERHDNPSVLAEIGQWCTYSVQSTLYWLPTYCSFGEDESYLRELRRRLVL